MSQTLTVACVVVLFFEDRAVILRFLAAACLSLHAHHFWGRAGQAYKVFTLLGHNGDDLASRVIFVEWSKKGRRRTLLLLRGVPCRCHPHDGEQDRNSYNEGGHHPPHEINLVLIHRVTHSRIQPHRHLSPQALQHFSSQLHPFFRDVEIHVATAKKDGGPC